MKRFLGLIMRGHANFRYADALESALKGNKINYNRKLGKNGEALFYIGWMLPLTRTRIDIVIAVLRDETMIRFIVYRYLVGVPTHRVPDMLLYINSLNSRCTCYKFFLDSDNDVQMSNDFLFDTVYTLFSSHEIIRYIGRAVHFLDQELPPLREVVHGGSQSTENSESAVEGETDSAIESENQENNKEEISE